MNTNLFVETLLWIGGAIVTISAAGKAIAGIIEAVKKPNREQDKRMDNHEDWMSRHNRDIEDINERLMKHDELFIRDGKRFDLIEGELRLLTRGMLATIRHSIGGATIDEMERVEKDITEYLIEK